MLPQVVCEGSQAVTVVFMGLTLIVWVIFLIAFLLATVLIFIFSRWRLFPAVGAIMGLLYVSFITVTLLQETNTIDRWTIDTSFI